MTKKELLRSIGNDVKCKVVMADIVMTAYCGWLFCTNSASILVGFLFGFSPWGAQMLWKASDLYDLCSIHKSMLVHSTLVYLCTIIQATYGWGNYRKDAQLAMFLYGIANLFVLLYNKYNEYKIWKQGI